MGDWYCIWISNGRGFPLRFARRGLFEYAIEFKDVYEPIEDEI